MIEQDALIGSVDKWRTSPVSCSSDVLLCALVELRLTTSALSDISSRPSKTRTIPPSLVKLTRLSVEQWSSEWLFIAEAGR
jgi:hypothetical protein